MPGLKSQRNMKALGPDGITGEIIKVVVRQSSCLLLRMYNAYLTDGAFYSPWKTARLVLISKGKGDPDAS